MFKNSTYINPKAVLCLAVSLCVGYMPLAISQDKITILTEQSYPLSYTKNRQDDGEVIGVGTLLVKAVMEKAGLDYDIAIVPWVRAMHTINNVENVMVYSMIRTPARESKFHWVGKIISVKYALYGLKRNLKTLPTTLMEAKHVSIGVNRGGIRHHYLRDNGFDNLVLIDSYERILKMVERGRIDLFPFSQFGMVTFAGRYGFASDHFVPVVQLEDMSNSMYMVLGKKTNKQLVKRISSAYTQLKDSGKVSEIISPLTIGAVLD